METPAETAERLRHASSFGAAAAAYADHRPSYSGDAIRWCLEPVSPAPGGTATRRPRVVDLGAGTGILTTALGHLGAEVMAIEPDADMLAELRRRLPGVSSAAGSAEALPLPDASVDAVLAGQAMHWFDMDRAVPEIARVLVPGGVFAGLWNVDDDRIGWVAQLAEMSKRKGSNTLQRWRSGNGQARLDQFATAGAGLFGPAETAEFGNGQLRTAESLVATIATHSHFLVMDSAERSSLLAQVSDFLQAQPETSSGEFTLPMLTIALRVQRV
jgi:SAM-dependent methyltransferase